MRVAIIAQPYVSVPPKKYGGTERVIFNLINGLLEAGHEPILIGPGDSKVECELIPTVEKSIFFPRTKSGLAKFNKEIAKISRRTDRLIRQTLPNVDVIHSHGFDIRKFQDFPNVTTLHGPILFDDIEDLLSPKRKNMNYVSISKNQQTVLPQLSYLGVAYNGEDPKDFPIVKKPQNYVCFVGRFDREKNPHLAIQLAIHYGIKIKLGGKIDYLGNDYFESEIKPYIKHPLVEYLGELGPKEVVEVLSKAKCNLHPTGFREPFGLTVVEAAYCGTPTLAIARGSMAELIEDGRTGILVEDLIEGYNRLDECFAMDRDYIAHRARMLFNYQAMTRSYIEAYEKAIDIDKRRRSETNALRSFVKKISRNPFTDYTVIP
ncbi:MAG TPA: glycosyltransferase family 4 protein [Candidatus Saccharimonadales bacterium]|nr:glycosyltransferase family 4 protein [Candidatus Saccharimonadales bacterium]